MFNVSDITQWFTSSIEQDTNRIVALTKTSGVMLLMPPSHLTLANKPKSGFLKLNLHTIDSI